MGGPFQLPGRYKTKDQALRVLKENFPNAEEQSFHLKVRLLPILKSMLCLETRQCITEVDFVLYEDER